jgi:TolA-binding protein
MFAFLTAIFLVLCTGLAAQTAGGKIKPDEQLLQEAKLLIFDKKWGQAEQKLSELLNRYPQSTFYA